MKKKPVKEVQGKEALPNADSVIKLLKKKELQTKILKRIIKEEESVENKKCKPKL